MAHDFRIEALKDDNEVMDHACFFGYCNGIMYYVFNAECHNAGVSGDYTFLEVTKAQAKAALDKAIFYFDRSGYPDPTRMNDIKSFRIKMDNELKAVETYRILFA